MTMSTGVFVRKKNVFVVSFAIITGKCCDWHDTTTCCECLGRRIKKRLVGLSNRDLTVMVRKEGGRELLQHPNNGALFWPIGCKKMRRVGGTVWDEGTENCATRRPRNCHWPPMWFSRNTNGTFFFFSRHGCDVDRRTTARCAAALLYRQRTPSVDP